MVATRTRPRLADLETRDLTGVEILSPGVWNGRPYTDAELDAAVEAFRELGPQGTNQIRPPGKLGHDDEQTLAQEDGFPAIGWVSNLYRSGKRLLADFVKVPAKVADLIKAGAYNSVSSEVYLGLNLNDKTYPFVLRAVSFLGADAPAVKDIRSISDVAALFTDTNTTVVLADYVASSDVPESKRGDMPASDFVFPDTRSFPIIDRSDVSDAVSSWGRYKGDHSFDEFKRRLSRMAKRKGFESDLPKEWTQDANAQNSDRDPDNDGDDDTTDDPKLNDAAQDKAKSMADDSDEDDTAAMAEDDVTTCMAEYDRMCQSLEQRISGKPGAKRLRVYLNTARRELAAITKPRTPFQLTEGTDMDTKKIAKLIGLPETATEAEIEARLGESRTNLADNDEVRKLREEVGTLRQTNLLRDAREVVSLAEKGGKLTPAMRTWAEEYALKDPDGFKKYIENTPRLSFLERIPEVPEGDEVNPHKDAANAEVARQLGSLAPSEDSITRASTNIPSYKLAEDARRKAVAVK